MLDRFQGNVLPFGVNSTGTERTVFGNTTQSDDINDNLNSDFLLGWEKLEAGSKPPKNWFNGLHYTLGYIASYLYQEGVATWDDEQEYFQFGICKGSDGKLYISQSGTDISPNVGNNPTIDNVNWKWILEDFVDLTSTQIITGAKTFENSGVTIKRGTIGNILINKTGTLETSSFRITHSGNGAILINTDSKDIIAISPTIGVLFNTAIGFGYNDGSGGIVTQITDKTTSVTLNKPTGRIITSPSILTAGSSALFTFNNNLITDEDVLIVNTANNIGHNIECIRCGSGIATIRITNITANSLSDVISISFVLIKGATV